MNVSLRDGTFQHKMFLGSLHLRCTFTFQASIFYVFLQCQYFHQNLVEHSPSAQQSV